MRRLGLKVVTMRMMRARSTEKIGSSGFLLSFCVCVNVLETLL